MKVLLLLTGGQGITLYIAIHYGLTFTVMERKTLYMTVTDAVVNFMKAILVIMYPNMLVKVSCYIRVANHFPTHCIVNMVAMQAGIHMYFNPVFF